MGTAGINWHIKERNMQHQVCQVLHIIVTRIVQAL